MRRVSSSTRARSIHWASMRMLANVAAVLLQALVLAGCAEDSGQITAPTASPEVLASKVAGGGTPDAAAGLVLCDLAVRSPAGKYRTRTVQVKVPREIFGADRKTVKFGVRGWVAGSQDPTRFTLCEIPNTAAALEWFKTAFGVGRSTAGGSGAQAARMAGMPTAIASATAAAATNDEAVMIYDVDGTCDRYPVVDYDCGCTGDLCGGWADGGGEWEGPAPSEPEQPEYWIDGGVSYSYDASTGDYLVTAVSCYGQTDRPHLSSTVFGNANVHSRTVCSQPLSISVSLSLQRQRCFLIFCWWSTVGTGYDGGFARLVQTNAAAFCQRGWYRGRGYHTVLFPSGSTGYTRTAHHNYLYC